MYAATVAPIVKLKMSTQAGLWRLTVPTADVMIEGNDRSRFALPNARISTIVLNITVATQNHSKPPKNDWKMYTYNSMMLLKTATITTRPD